MHSQYPALPTFEELCEQEPRLFDLAERIRTLKPNNESTLSLWYGNANSAGIKDVLVGLVGYEAADPRLRDTESYDVAYDHLLALLEETQRTIKRN